MIAVVLGATLLVSATTSGSGTAPGAQPADPAIYGIWKKRIKRLKPADPESTEEMLALVDDPRTGAYDAIA